MVVYIIYIVLFTAIVQKITSILLLFQSMIITILLSYLINPPVGGRVFTIYNIHLETRITPRTHVIIDYNIRVIRSVAAGKH